MTLSTPTSVCIPLNSQRTSSQRTALWRSGRTASVSISNWLDHSTRQQHQYSDPEHDSVDSKRRKSPCPHPMHKPGDHSQSYEKGNYKSDCKHDPFMAIHSHWRVIRLVMIRHHHLHKI